MNQFDRLISVYCYYSVDTVKSQLKNFFGVWGNHGAKIVQYIHLFDLAKSISLVKVRIFSRFYVFYKIINKNLTNIKNMLKYKL